MRLSNALAGIADPAIPSEVCTAIVDALTLNPLIDLETQMNPNASTPEEPSSELLTLFSNVARWQEWLRMEEECNGNMGSFQLLRSVMSSS